MNEFLLFYIVISWLLLAGLMWSDWYEDRKPDSFIGVLFLFIYISFMSVFWLSRIGRK